MNIHSDDILPHSMISKSRSKRKSKNMPSPDRSDEMDITFSHIDHENDVGTCDDGIPLDQIILQESLLSQESHNIHLTNDQLDSFNSCAGSEHGLSVNSPLVEMLSTPVMKIEEDAEN